MQVYGIHRERKFSPPALNSLASMNSRQFHQFMNEMLDCVAFLNAFLTELDELTVHMETYHDVGCFNRERNKALEVYGAWNDWIIFPFLQESWRRQRGSKLGRKGELFERNLNTLTKRALELSLNVTTRQASNKQRMITNTMTVVSSWEALISCVIATHSHKNEGTKASRPLLEQKLTTRVQTRSFNVTPISTSKETESQPRMLHLAMAQPRRRE